MEINDINDLSHLPQIIKHFINAGVGEKMIRLEELEELNVENQKKIKELEEENKQLKILVGR